MAKVELTGMEELQKMLHMIGERIAVRAENKALREGAEIVREDAARRAPRSKLNKPHLADNIIKSGVKTDKGTGVKYIDVGPSKNFFYGLFLELGTSKMTAKPFMAPALEEKRDEIYGTMADVLWEELTKKR